jgi:hypothetical protein
LIENRIDSSAALFLSVARFGGALQVAFRLGIGLDLLLGVGLGLRGFAGGLPVTLARFIGRIECVPDGHKATQQSKDDGRLCVDAHGVCSGGRDHEQLPGPQREYMDS